MRGVAILTTSVLGAIGVGLGVIGALGGSLYPSPAFACRPPTDNIVDPVQLLSGHSEWLLDVPVDAEIVPPPFSTIDHLALLQAVCFGPNVPKPIQAGDPTQVRVAWQDPHSRIWRLGPVVMAYEGLFDTRVATAFTPGHLWLYDPLTTSGSLAVRVSASSGEVEQVVRMPFIDRPVAYPSQDGIWIYDRNQGVDTSNYTMYHLSPELKVSELRHQSLAALPR